MRFVRFVLCSACAFAVAACGAQTPSSLPMTAEQLPQSTQMEPQPLSPQRFASLQMAQLPNEASLHPELGNTYGAAARSGSRSRMSTEQVGNPGFQVGILTPASISTIFARVTAYTTSQFTLKYPPSGATTPPSLPERFIGPEIEPGPSCLLEGLVYVNFGPGGTQRNGPGNPIQFVVGPYNALRVVDFCTLDAHGAPTFFLTPITATFVQKYVRMISGVPFISIGVGSNSPHAATNPNAVWYALIYNFNTLSWQSVHQSTGNAGPNQGDVVAYPGTQNLPEKCPSLKPLIAKDISVLNPSTGFFQAAIGTQYPTVYPNDFGGSLACFRADSTGPASYAFYRIGAYWVLRNHY